MSNFLDGLVRQEENRRAGREIRGGDVMGAQSRTAPGRRQYGRQVDPG